jgi:fatty acid desaturase
MLPRVRADYRALLWVFVLMPAVAVTQLLRPSLAVFLFPLSLYLAYSAAVLAHNHNHVRVFTNKAMNGLYSSTLSFFYGYPTFAWIPTHNENHHRFRNGPGDVAATSRYAKEGTAWAALTYFFWSAAQQAPLTARYLRRARARSFALYVSLLSQYVVVYGGHALVLAWSIHTHGAKLGTLVYLSALGIPAVFALWGIIFTNYVQHDRTDSTSTWDHSRNFTSRWMNFLLFDNGFHTVHHERPGLHWSKARAEHEKIAHHIDPRLNESSIFDYAWKAYVVASLRRTSSWSRPDTGSCPRS